MGSEEQQRHLTYLAIAHICYAALGLVITGFMFMSFVGVCALPMTDSDDSIALVSMTVLGGLFAFLLLVGVLPGLIGGIALLKRQKWSRILLLIVGGLNLIAFPIGTTLGAYTFVVLWDANSLENSDSR